MRFSILALPMITLAGCISQPPAPDAAAMAAPVPFTAPMDPGQIRCSDLSNPTALAAATDWAMGQARAAVMAGNSDAVPERAALSAQITNACAANSGSTIGMVM